MQLTRSMPRGQHLNRPCDITGPNIILWSYKNTFLCAKKKKMLYSTISLLCHSDVTWTTLIMSLQPFWALIVVVSLLIFAGSESSVISSKISNLCSEDEQRSYGFRTTWGFHFCWTIPLNPFQICNYFKSSKKIKTDFWLNDHVELILERSLREIIQAFKLGKSVHEKTK